MKGGRMKDEPDARPSAALDLFILHPSAFILELPSGMLPTRGITNFEDRGEWLISKASKRVRALNSEARFARTSQVRSRRELHKNSGRLFDGAAAW
jgi:hypothetical protein